MLTEVSQQIYWPALPGWLNGAVIISATHTHTNGLLKRPQPWCTAGSVLTGLSYSRAERHGMNVVTNTCYRPPVWAADEALLCGCELVRLPMSWC